MTETEIVVQDIRRELRWSYRDQSVANLLGLAKRLIDNKDTASIADAVKKYTAVLSAARQSANPAALERWPTTTDYSDFNQISSTLMLGALCHKCLGVAEQDLLEDIQHAAFMTVVCARLRNHGQTIPAANLEPVKHGLIVAQELMEYAYEHERQALINVLKHNTHETLAETPGLREAHERFILGKHYEQVRQWEIEDDAFLGELQATGKFKEQAEEAK